MAGPPQHQKIQAYLESLARPTKTFHHNTYDRISTHHNFNSKGKTVLITGGASGLGLQFSHAFARAGVSRIAIISRSSNQQDEAKATLSAAYPNTEILTFRASITDSERTISIIQSLGTIDILVLNAAVAHRRMQASDLTSEEMRDAFNTNVLATFDSCKAFLALPTPPSGRKTIISVSAAAIHLPGSFRAGYASSKAAAAMIMQNFAAQYADSEAVRVFSFHPGSHYTPGVAANMPKDAMQWDDERLPADFGVWLAGEDSAFLHGRWLWANWDVDELVEAKEKFEKNPSYCTIGLIQ